MTDDDRNDEAPQKTKSQEIGETSSDDKADEAAAPVTSDPPSAAEASASDPSSGESANEDLFDFEIPVTPELDAALASERGQSSKPASPEEKSANEAPTDPPQQKLRIIIDVRAPEASTTPDKSTETPGAAETGTAKGESTPANAASPQGGEKTASDDSASSTKAPPELSLDEVEAALNGQPASETSAASDSSSSTGEVLLPIALPVTLRHADRLMLAAFEKLAPELEQIMCDMTEDCKEEVLWQFTAEMRALNIWR